MKLVGSAQLVPGGKEMISMVLDLLESSGVKTRGNPDLYLREYAHFGIEEARELRSRASYRALSGDRRTFILSFSTISSEAQNALLKTLEEPPADALFFFIFSSPETLLPTLRSRMQILSFGTSMEAAGAIDASAFMRAKPQSRISMLAPLLEKGEDDKRDIGAIISFLSGLEKAVGKSKNANAEGLKAIYRAKKYISDGGALVKPLLEQVALLI